MRPIVRYPNRGLRTPALEIKQDKNGQLQKTSEHDKKVAIQGRSPWNPPSGEWPNPLEGLECTADPIDPAKLESYRKQYEHEAAPFRTPVTQENLNQRIGRRIYLQNFFDSDDGIIKDMLDYLTLPETAGIAAPQLGYNTRIFAIASKVCGTPNQDMFFINPQIQLGTEFTIEEEGCLSLPGFLIPVWRATEVSCVATDLDGKTFSLHETGFYARCIQHEMDHLNGITLYDHATYALKAKIRKHFAPR